MKNILKILYVIVGLIVLIAMGTLIDSLGNEIDVVSGIIGGIALIYICYCLFTK